MTAIWRNDGSGWQLLAPVGFPDEAALHALVEETPQILPLAGDPRLIVVGKEVLLGNGYVDLIAVEPTGRLAIIEIKLAKNTEARRAVVTQILTYAAHLKGLNRTALERDVLGRHLHGRGYENLEGAVAANDQEGSFDPVAFSQELAESLTRGYFRLVLVLDEAPEELVRLVRYLESVTDQLLIDLVTVSAYEIGGSRVLIPQRVDAEHQTTETSLSKSTSNAQGWLAQGAGDFTAAIDESPEEHRPELRRLCNWAVSLEHEGLAKLSTYHGKANRLTLLPRLVPDNAGLVTIYNDGGTPYLQFWRSVFERRAPENLSHVEQTAPVKVGQGNTTREISDELLQALTDAYREAASGKIGG